VDVFRTPDGDPMISTRVAHSMAKLIPTAGEPEFVSGASHFLQEDRSEEIATRIARSSRGPDAGYRYPVDGTSACSPAIPVMPAGASSAGMTQNGTAARVSSPWDTSR